MGKTIVAIVLFAAAGAIFFLYTQPNYAAAGATQQEIAQYQQALSQAAQLQQLKQTLLAKYNAFDPNQIARLDTMLPDDVNNIGLILDINGIAARYGLALENVDVAPPNSSTASGAAGSGSIGTALPYDTLAIHFTTYGTYANFLSFVTDLEQSLRVVDLTSVVISPASNPGTASAASYNYDMTIQTYWLK